MKSRIAFSLIAGVLALSASASAGLRWTYSVYITRAADGSGSMTGTLGSTRNNADSVSRLGCYYEQFTGSYGSYKYASCYGYDGATAMSCGTTDPALTDTISRLPGDGYLHVQVDASGNCTRVQIGSQSWAAPKAP